MGCSVKTGSFGNGGGGGIGKTVFSKTGVKPFSDNALYLLSEEEFNKIFKNDKTYIVSIALEELNTSGGMIGETYIFGASQYSYDMTITYYGGYNASNVAPVNFTSTTSIRTVGVSTSSSTTWNNSNTYSITIIECASY